jgi:perosamine synthetase
MDKNKTTIGIHEPLLEGDDINQVSNCLKSTYVSTASPLTTKFQKKLKKFTKSKYVLPLVNGASSLHLAMRVLDLKEDEEVLVPSFTFISTVNAIKYFNANPHFIDINERNLCADASKLKQYLQSKKFDFKNRILINKKTKKKIKKLIVVHAYGNYANMNELCKIAKKYKLKIIEDAAGSLGVNKNNKHAGTIGDIGILSFNGNKIITTGGGGAILCKNKSYYLKAYNLSRNAKSSASKKQNYLHNDIGYNYLLPGINSALGLSQLKKIKKILKIKKKIYLGYQKMFRNIKKYKLNIFDKNFVSNYWINYLVLDSCKLKNSILKKLGKNSIFLGTPWFPLHLQKIFINEQKMDMSTTNDIYKRILLLPSGTNAIKFFK